MDQHVSGTTGGRARRRRRRSRQGGSALIITIVVLSMMAALAFALAGMNATRYKGAVLARDRARLLAAAEAGIGFKLDDIVRSEGANANITRSFVMGDITITVTGENLGTNGVDDGDVDSDVDNSLEKDIIRVRSIARDRLGQSRGIETFMRSSFHPLFNKAVYVGNRNLVGGYSMIVGPANGANRTGDPNATESASNASTTAAENSTSTGFEEAPHQQSDFIAGDVWVNGNFALKGTTNMYGNLDVTGTATGRPVTGQTKLGSNRMEPPDLAAMNYQSIADTVITPTGSRNPTSVDFIHEGTFAASGDNTYFTAHPSEFTGRNFQFGKSGGMSTTTTVNMSSVTGTGNQLIYVKGNLWLESEQVRDYALPSSADGKKVTIVVEGNLYISDQLSYNNYTKDAILFIVKGKDDDGSTSAREDESYIDGYKADGTRDPALINSKYDPGERIINDDGNGTYDGPKEGQGNIYFGDRSQTAGGVTDGFMYAQNNGYLMTNNVAHDIFGVRGFFSAGGVLDLHSSANRNQGSNFTNYRVRWDKRLSDGSISLKGLPPSQGGGFNGLFVASWREFAPGAGP